jgi:threonine/homoserine/homoserine lactone efflux protein
MFGIGALLQSSVVWLTVLKWVGGAYLVWLGIQVWRAPPIGMNESMVAGQRSGASMFREGALSALTNPKAILFFAAFLPQFIDPQRDLWVQFVILSATFVGVEIAYEFFVAAMAARIRPWLRRVGKTFNRMCGGFFVALGAALPLRG